ncbi:MAG: ATP-dependent sacrificial sulfur transferase LarE [Oscillospiraceae bacterium]|jgi:uncharacterized protein|nr:ATP-dependent sacrificial sulfur transferase LarE [Oscillospiraceae bacterium]
MTTQEKNAKLKARLAALPGLVVAFSGGVDSTFLLKTAHDAIGDNVIAVTARSCSFPERELREAQAFCAAEGIMHVIVDSEELEIEGFSENPTNRCYMCKNELFTKIWEVAKVNNIAYVCEGSNMDDEGDYRPGLQAVAEQGALSPLREAELYKADIRELSRELGLDTADKQSFACLSSRFPYGETITKEKLRQIDEAEQTLLDLGLKQVRVRHHGEVARIETDENGFHLFEDKDIRKNLYTRFKNLGFTYVSLDLLGYRTGSMNETL